MAHLTDDRPFRFYDNRQKYLAFVNTCNEKWKVAERATQELTHIRPLPPALRLFDAGVGDGTVLGHLMRAMHRRFPTIPFFIVGFELTILFAVFGNVIGLITQARLPSFKHTDYYDPRCSGEHFGVLAACEPMQQDGLKDFFQKNGGEVKVFD